MTEQDQAIVDYIRVTIIGNEKVEIRRGHSISLVGTD